MIFDWSGLKHHKYFVLNQISNPLKYCNYALPFPMPIGLPFMPCDLPNEYELYQSNQSYQQQGDIYLTFQQSVPVLERILLPASHRPWTIIGKDYYQHIPYEGTRDINCCFSSDDRPTVAVKYQEQLIGGIRQITILNCCCLTEVYQAFDIFDSNNQIIYRVVSKNPQKGHKIILPWWGFDKIRYEITRLQQGTQLQSLEQQKQQMLGGTKVGQIVHLFNGLSEYSSKNDRYGIEFPDDSNERDKCLIVYCTLLIDYLLFCNF